MVKLSYIYKIFYFFKKRVAFVKNDVIIRLTRDINLELEYTRYKIKILTLLAFFHNFSYLPL
ncbi:hypothetical protein SDAV_00168 [Spiroplasma phoeniceum P40]|uniref:Uncharacterized protein n=1 Tax=Spiroplasma phoeniceum P40 TaxID=1276259 RepID=A0A345DLS7_9MOLU|nr:hypothetical protein SDAV_00168 [Spiroplasma phoeniceum P40]